MVELGSLMNLLNADFVMSHEVAAQLSGIACNLRKKYQDYFIALNIGGSTVNGGAVAKSVLYNIIPDKAISDIDYSVILSRDISKTNRKLLHEDIKNQLGNFGFVPCTGFNAENVYLVVEEPYNMSRWMLDIKKDKPIDAGKYLATRLLMPFGAVFPFSERKQLQEAVENSLIELGQTNPDFEKEIRSAMNETLQQRRKMKEKHIPDKITRDYIDLNIISSKIHF